jgi:hypothetical protein
LAVPARAFARACTDRSLIPNFAAAEAVPCTVAHDTAARLVSAS